MQRYCCCSTTSACQYVSDDFSGTLANWTQSSGTWSIVSGELTTSDTTAKILHNTLHPDSEAAIILDVDVKGSNGDIARFYVCGFYIEIEFSSTCAEMRFYESDGTLIGVVHPLTTFIDTFIHVTVCYYDTLLSVNIENGVFVCYDAPSSTDYSGGLGTGSTNTGVVFDNFSLTKHYSTTNPDCPVCCTGTYPQSCLIFEDTFATIDPTDYTCFFFEETGSWSLGATGLTSSGAGRLKHLLPHPKLKTTQILDTVFTLNTTGVEAGAFIDYNGSDKYLATAEILSTTPESAELQLTLYINGTVSGTKQFTVTFSPGSGAPDIGIQIELTLCFTGSRVFANFLFSSGVIGFGVGDKVLSLTADETGNTDGYYVGLENLGTNDALYTHFRYEMAYTTEEAYCNKCESLCIVNLNGTRNEVPCTIKLKMANWADKGDCTYPDSRDCSGMNGSFIADFYGGIVEWISGNYFTYDCNGIPIPGYYEAKWYYDYAISKYVFKVTISTNVSQEVAFSKTYTTFPDMFSWSDEDIPFDGLTYDNCVNTPNPTCKVSPV